MNRFGTLIFLVLEGVHGGIIRGEGAAAVSLVAKESPRLQVAVEVSPRGLNGVRVSRR